MPEQHITADIPAFLSNTLPESRRREVETHTAECERCHRALDKARAKQSAKRREALKSATPAGPANLFLNRLVKQEGIDRPSSIPWGWILSILLIAAGGYWLWRHPGHWTHAAPVIPAPETATLSAGPVAREGAPVLPVVQAPPAVQPARPAAKVSEPPAVAAPEASLPETPRFWTGAESNVKDEREVVIKGRSSWRALWEEMGRAETAPRINFNELFVIGIFAGEKPSAGYTVQLKEPQDDAESAVVAYAVDAPPAGTSPASTPTHPYSLRTIVRGSKPIRFLEETHVGSTATKEN